MSQTQTYDFSTQSDYIYNTNQIEVDIASGQAQLLEQGTITPYTENFNDSTGLTFNSSLIEISSGKAQLKNLETPSTYTEDFTSSGQLTYNSSDILISGGSGSLLLQDNSGQTFNEDFTDDTGFTYDSGKSEFSGGQVQQIDNRPNANVTSWITYTTDLDMNYAIGTATGTGVGSPTIVGNKLDLKGGGVKYVSYDANGNADSLQVGAVKVKYTPNYSGNPVATRTLFTICDAIGVADNRVQISHVTSGNLQIVLTDQDGTNFTTVGLGVWSPVSGTTYEIEFNWDITTGANRLFVDGNQFGATDTGTGTRDSNVGVLLIGTNWNGAVTSDMEIEDVVIFNDVQHTTNYTPGYTLEESRYLEDAITLPTFAYSGTGSIQAFTNIISTESNTPRYIMNDQYYSGGWVASSDTWATASPLATVLANIATLPTSDTMIIKVVTNSGSSQMSVNDLTLTYTGQIYPITNPTIDLDNLITATVTSQAISALTSFTDTVTEPGSDAITFVLSTDNGVTWQYWNGSIWTTSSGYAQSNDGATINTNIGSLTLTTTGIKIRIYLHSDSGDTTPEISNLIVGYNDYIYSTANPTVDLDSGITPAISGNTITSWTSFVETVTTTGSDLIKYTLSDDNGSTYKYWNGSAWVTSSGYSQSNTGTEVNTNFSTFPKTIYGMKILVYLHSEDGSSMPDIDNLVVSYQDASYLTTNPTIEIATALNLDGITSVVITDSASGNDTVRYTFISNGVERYWDGASWSVSDGTYVQTNTKTDFTTNITSYDVSAGKAIKFKAYLHSDNGTTTPYLDAITIVYSFYGGDPTEPTKCIAYGYMRDIDGTAPSDVTVKIQTANNCKYSDEIIVTTTPITVTPNVNGYFELDAIPTSLLTPSTEYKVTFKGTKFRRSDTVTVPNQASVNYATLVTG